MWQDSAPAAPCHSTLISPFRPPHPHPLHWHPFVPSDWTTHRPFMPPVHQLDCTLGSLSHWAWSCLCWDSGDVPPPLSLLCVALTPSCFLLLPAVLYKYTETHILNTDRLCQFFLKSECVHKRTVRRAMFPSCHLWSGRQVPGQPLWHTEHEWLKSAWRLSYLICTCRCQKTEWHNRVLISDGAAFCVGQHLNCIHSPL